LVHEVANALARGANIQSYDRFGCNALHWAANNGLHECAKYLLDAGARVDEPVNKRQTNSTPLSLAVFSGSEETVELLLSRGAQPNGLESSSSRPLALAVSGSEGRMLPILLAWGADPNGVDKKSGTSALMLAAEGERYALMELLIAAGALLDLKDAHGRDAHERAMAKGCEGSAAWLKGRASAMLERDEISKKLGDPAGAKAGIASRL
jgi:ankyrin repeat protein